MCDLRPVLTGHTILGVEVHWEGAIAVPSPAEFRCLLPGQRIEGVERRGKFVVLRLSGYDLLIHLRMTGQLLVVAPGEHCGPRHLRVALALSGKRLLFNDTRKFGRMYLVRDRCQVLGSLGPEPLASDFTPERLGEQLGGRRVPIKSLLLNQRLLAGVGNIYADETLHIAGIAPQRQACTLNREEIIALHSGLREALQRAIHNRGTTLSDYRDAQGREGGHREHLRVYGRAGQPCLRCGAPIQRDRIGGRSSYYCAACQR